MDAIIFVFLGAFLAIAFCGFLIRWIFRQPAGNETMQKISGYIFQGAKGYLKQQYKVVSIFFVLVFLVLLAMALKGFLVIFVPFAFLTGGLFSGFCGWLGMYVATKSNSRTTQAASISLNRGLRLAFSAGTVMGLMVVGLGLLEMATWFVILKWYYTVHQPLSGDALLTAVTSTMLCFGMGASSYALFARLGGGIYTKAADVGADLVGKVEAGIPEDDPRNPAVIADLVGDNVGDVAGMGADLYESYVDSIVATMALAAAAGLGLKGAITPLLMATCGVAASLIGFFFVKTKEEATQKDLLRALRRGVWTASGLVILFSFLIVYYVLGKKYLGVFGSVVIGLLTGVVIGQFTEFFTSAGYRPTRDLARSSKTGPATLIIEGIALGMLSPVGAVLAVGCAILGSFAISGGFNDFGMGLYGVGISAVGMLSTLGITLATDAYGPVADNAGGVAQMAQLPKEVRRRTDQLDSLGNTTAATGKGFAIGSAALTALALIVAYRDHIINEALRLGIKVSMDVSLFDPNVIVGIFIGAMLPFIFCALSLRAVSRAAAAIIEEVRRQFRQIKGLLEGKAEADYSTCVALTTKAAQHQMIIPSLLAIIAPIATGMLLGVRGEIGLLVGALASGFVLAVFMANSGGAWDNAKKYIEEGNHGGKGSDSHRAAVCGDTVGDPFKDTAGPSLNILIKLMSMVSIVFSGLIISYSLFK
ncbi:MAG: sodium-translocating pyrophosphatase [Candidatus Omnitrophica bacterium]|nr:sodium-translocating pyrophosphatase [Candidatus Omnitrophota bacterium]MBU2251227.1 sodium-translocating pyrophosphatase [Candidatus Omnitrophota bacterium]MBU2266359.1 sodium-translocating pyrophosphatase [Candidatus Omnitrophota bacterium]